jgi:hypothetical protein
LKNKESKETKERETMKIKKWIKGDEVIGFGNKLPKNTKALLKYAGVALDDACSHEIVGECLFQGQDGKYYAGTVEFVIQEANPEYVKSALEELEEMEE